MTTTEARKVTIQRVIEAPVEKIYQAWIDEKAIAQWFGCDDTKMLAVESEAKVGGKRNIKFENLENGQIRQITGEYLEMVPNEVLKFTWHSPDFEIPCPNMVVTVTFKSVNNTTELTILHENIPAGEMDEAFSSGWERVVEKLQHYTQSI